MNILVSTMGKYLDIGANVIELMKERIPIDKIGFFVANSKHFKSFAKTNSFLKTNDVMLLKEWEYTLIPPGVKPNIQRITSFERRLGDPTLWNALMADRRVFFGEYCKSKQDYTPRYSYEELMVILDQALCSIENFFKILSPDLVLSFGTSVLGDYLIYLFAKNKGIPYLQLKATKVKNYIALHDSPIEFSSLITKRYANESPLSDDILEEARSYFEDILQKGLKYEGAILSSHSRLMKRLIPGPLNVLKGVYGSLKNYSDPILRKDCHIPGRFRSSIHYNVSQPVKSYLVERKLRKHKKFVEFDDLSASGDFFFFPLHFEPEVSLQVFGRPYQNQIELIRNIALSAPVGTKIIVKEHPRSIGFRPYAYYRKLLDIPNVYLIDPFIKAYHVVPHAQIVAVITGSIGLEAAVLGKPVITFGNAAYNILPDSMVRQIVNLNTLGMQIKVFLKNYSYERKYIEKYIGSIIDGSTPVDLYSALIGKNERNFENMRNLTEKERVREGYSNLIEYYIRQFRIIGLDNGERSLKGDF